MKSQPAAVYKSITSPDNIVVIGASNDPSKPGGSVTRNIVKGGYKGTLLAVNPKDPSIMDLPTFKTIAELPDEIELAVIAIPAPFVRQAILDLAEKNTRTIMILTAGFGEVDEKGREEEQRFLEIAAEHDITIIGPNCVGIVTPDYWGKFAGIIPELRPGRIDMISASGATVDYLMEQADMRGLTFSNVISLGNSIQQGVEDVLALADEGFNDSSSNIIMLYMESIKKPRKLVRHARSLIRKGCTIIGIKSGVTEAGERAAASHTGAMSTSDTAVQALFDKAGIIRVQSKKELVDIGCVLSAIGTEHSGNRACIVTDAGGPGVMLSDELNRQGWELPVLKEGTREKLLEHLPRQASVMNPVDCLPSQTAEQTRAVFEILESEESGNLDVVIITTGNSMLFDKWDTYQVIADGMDNCSIPIIPVLSPITTTSGLLNRMKELEKSFFYEEVAVGQALGKILNRPVVYDVDSEDEVLPGYDKGAVDAVISKAGTVLTPGECLAVLTAAGINTPMQVEVLEPGKLDEACRQVGFPLVMKVIGPLHKSDVGGVRVGIENVEDARTAQDTMMKIEGAEGVLLQQMATGTEVIMGVSKEGAFGHVIMFGLGGIYTEVLKDVNFRLAPLGREESLELTRSIRSVEILKGVRGVEGVSFDVLADFLVRLSQLVTDFPQIREIDLNPVKGTGENLFAVDSRILLDPDN